MISLTQKAVRLHRDLDIEWSGIALAIGLIEELEQLRDENKTYFFYSMVQLFILTSSLIIPHPRFSSVK
jgi:MerR HTH family regulatory protein